MNDIETFEVLRNTIVTLSESRYRNAFVIKGGAALICKMMESGNQRLIRKTTDVDIHCGDAEIWKRFIREVDTVLNNNRFGYVYKVLGIRSLVKNTINSDSIKIGVQTPKGSTVMKIDMNIKSNRVITVEYSSILCMNTYDRYTMLADKIVVVCSSKIYRRIKDMYDIYALSIMGRYTSDELIRHIEIKNPDAILERIVDYRNIEQISNAYDRFVGIVNKPNIYMRL